MASTILSRINALIRAGRFADAIEQLAREVHRLDQADVPLAQVLEAELSQDTGVNRRAKNLAEKLLRKRGLDPLLRSRAYTVLGQVLAEDGEPRQALKFFQKSLMIASQSGAVQLGCGVLLKILGTLTDFSTSQAIGLCSQAKRSTADSGDPQLSVILHTRLGEIEANRGSTADALRHFQLAQSLLSAAPNAWLEGALRLSFSATLWLMSNFEDATDEANRALVCSGESGHAKTKLAATANLGLLYLTTGKIEEAERYCRQALKLGKAFPRTQISILDNYALLLLAKDKYQECARVLSFIDKRIANYEMDSRSRQQLGVHQTRIRLSLRMGESSKAEAISMTAVSLADARSDKVLGVLFRVLQADALLALDRVENAANVIAEASDMSAGAPIATLAELERVKGKALAKLGSHDDARRDFERAVRMLSVVGHAQARETASADYAAAINGGELSSGNIGGRGGFQEAESLFVLASNAELFAREAYATLQAEGCARCCALLVARNGRPLQLLSNHGWTRTQALNEARRASDAKRWALGSLGERSFFMVAEAADGLPAHNGLTTFRHLVELAAQLEAFREDERYRSSMWPADVPANREDGIYVAAQTVENFAMAKRIASSRATVLLTGDTGTGKEVLARAIHRHSDRRDQAFVPFSCQATPHDMLDSQLFGHRRGAFTGAQENFPGVIRAAAGGTLFLDEIGELALDVQPKLLRFLESSEIHPLGESRPLTVDVRVISATNAPLEQYVSEGRFREDLYYRLNVHRFRMPPLRERREEIPPLVHQFLQQYAQEENKGRLRLAEETLEYLLLYPWPGNVRELANEIRRLVSVADANATLRPEHLSPEILAARRTVPASQTPGAPTLAEGHLSINLDQPLGLAVAELERAIINRALGAAGGRVEHAARTLKISRKGLFLKRRRLGLKGVA